MTRSGSSLRTQDLLYRSSAFALTGASVRQGDYRALAPSRTRIRSNFPRPRQEIHFKFSLDGHDNERPPGKDHRFYLQPAEDGTLETPVYTFGEPDPPEANPPEQNSAPFTHDTLRVTFRLNMRPVLESFREKGYYEIYTGARLSEEMFDGVYIAGGAAPLTWDFEALPEDDRYRLTNPDGDGIYTVTLPFAVDRSRPLGEEGYAVWSLQKDLSRFPEYQSPQRLVDALYNLSLEELLQDVREDGALMAGREWSGVWTRDVSYSILLSLALVVPETARKSLMAKVDARGRVIQDIGTGGSWPVSTDRMTWALAAWELYKTTGSRDWLRKAYRIIESSAEVDLKTARDPLIGLFYGESSFLDWREQSYPRWMDPKDIYESQALGTNVVHYATYRILERMAEILGEPTARYAGVADAARAAINERFWRPERGVYGQFRYGRAYKTLSTRAEALGAALAVLFDVAGPERARETIARFPLVPFGVASFYPQTPDIPPYHNDGIWPFVVAYWTWAAARVGNGAAAEHGLASLYRAAALFLTNKENMAASTGDYRGTELNSDRQLWSVAGTLATVYRVFFGMHFAPDRLVFEPFVPAAYAGTRTLKGFRYREATLDVTVEGHGSAVERAVLDGEETPKAEIPADLKGPHALEITLNGDLPSSSSHRVENRYALRAPEVYCKGEALVWDPVQGAKEYRIYRNGRPIDTTTATRYPVAPGEALQEYQVMAVGEEESLSSFLSEPIRVVAEEAVQIVQPSGEGVETEEEGYTGTGYLPLARDKNTTVHLPVEIERAGTYRLDARYANGSGPINTEDKAALRTLQVDGGRAGPIVMPQRGEGAWSDWGYSSGLTLRLDKGRHVFTLLFTEDNENMNGKINQALLDHLRLTRLDDASDS